MKAGECRVRLGSDIAAQPRNKSVSEPNQKKHMDVAIPAQGKDQELYPERSKQPTNIPWSMLRSVAKRLRLSRQEIYNEGKGIMLLTLVHSR